MNPAEKEKYLKSLDDLISSTEESSLKEKIEEIKLEILYNELNEEPWKTPFGNWFFLVILILFLLFSFLKLAIFKTLWWDSELCAPKQISYDLADGLIYFFWLVGPPVFFLIEYVFLFGKNRENRLNSRHVDDLKYCQDLASKIWAAIVVCFSALLYLKYGIK